MKSAKWLLSINRGFIIAPLCDKPMRNAICAAVVVITGGVLFTVLAAFSPSDVILGLKGLWMRSGGAQMKSDALFFSRLAAEVRSSGAFAMEEASRRVKDPFIREALLLAAGGIDAETLRCMLASRVQDKKDRFGDMERFWQFMVSVNSAWGMIGALTGMALTAMGGKYAEDGPMIAVAAAVYGILLSQCIMLPVLLRVKSKANKYIRRMLMVNEGLISVKEGDPPGFTEEKLRFLSGLDGGLFG